MNLISPNKKKTKKELKKYGLVMFSALSVISALLFFREKAGWLYTSFSSLFFLISALVFPQLLAPIEKVWMKLAGVMGFIMTNVLLTLVYFLGIVPIGLLLRLFKGGSFEKGFHRKASSYWLDIPLDGPSSRPDKPF